MSRYENNQASIFGFSSNTNSYTNWVSHTYRSTTSGEGVSWNYVQEVIAPYTTSISDYIDENGGVVAYRTTRSSDGAHILDENGDHMVFIISCLNIYFELPIDLDNITNAKGGKWDRIGNALGAVGITYEVLENAVANKYWWLDAKGNYNSTKILSKGVNGKYIKGVQGYRNGYNSALNAASKFKVASNIVGGLGIGVTFIQLRTNQISKIEAGFDFTFGIISFIGPVGAGIGSIYILGKLGYEYFTGNSLFDKPR